MEQLNKNFSQIAQPVAKKITKELTTHCHKRIDNYYWLKDKSDPEVIKYLENENNYTEEVMAHTRGLQEDLFHEIKGRIKQTDMSVPYIDGNYKYYTKYEDGKEYPIYCRARVNSNNEDDINNITAEEIILDVNELAKGHAYYNVASLRVSPNENILSFSVDTSGNRIYNVYFKDLTTNKILEDVLVGVTSNLEWANNNKTIFYADKDEQTLRSNKIYRHDFGTSQSEDKLLYTEIDETFNCYVAKSKSKQYMFIGSYQTVSTEYRYLDLNNPYGDFEIFYPREREHEYHLDHINDNFYIQTNYKAKNFRLMSTFLPKTDKQDWREVIAYNDKIFLEGFELFENYIVLSERENGLSKFRVLDIQGNKDYYIKFDEPAYLINIAANEVPDTDWFRFSYTSMTTPPSVFEYNMQTNKKKLLKKQEILGNFNKNNYKTERLFATAKDGAKVPISLVYRKEKKNANGNPLLLYAYGSYGHSIDAGFSPARVSLLDRGVIFAIAHVRGGEDLGRKWYDNGRLLNKKNTFNDFIECAKYLKDKKYAAMNSLFAQGGSAGGLLVGAVANMEPKLFKGVIAEVPFVDVVTTMLDSTIPLTTGEYDEWGNPNNPEYYDYILSYSPYDNVEAKDYPNMLVTAGLNDSQVHYWEPAKWVAKLRDMKTDNNKLLLKTEMDFGHGGASGRYETYKEIAFIYAFILDLL